MAKNRNYTVLAIDLDGTLIGRDQRISPVVSASVKRISEVLNVCIVSGREPSDVLAFAKELGLKSPQVSDNGAMILDPSDRTVIWYSALGRENAEKIINLLDVWQIAFIASYVGGTVRDVKSIANQDFIRVSALDLEQHIADKLVSHFDDISYLHVVKVSLPYNGMWAVDFTYTGVTKGAAIRRLARILNVPTKEIIAVGDSYNDLPLLKECGLKIAMGDAPYDLKIIADYVAPSVELNGLAVAIEQIIFPKL
jgi:HAD superfamily hydrolase (TIGR01484 family)